MANNQKFQETLKHLLYAGVGFAAESSKKVQKNVDELIKKGKINEREGKKIVDQVMHNTELKRKELETKLNKVVDQYGKTGLNQITSLTKKIQKLETELQKRVKSATASVGGC
jgi:polyhydroxyalkanoate synthesis regulator phasin